MVRPSCDETKMRRGFGMPKDDPKMTTHVSDNDAGKWIGIAKKAELKRCGKSCRLRKTNHPRPDLKHDNFSPQEEELIIRLHAAIGSRWTIIAQQLPGRTDNDVKNLWNTKLRKKLTEMGIDPVTHKPFSQILADYGNLGAMSEPGSRVGSLNGDPRNAYCFPKPGQSPNPNPNIHNHFMNTTSSEIKPIQECFLHNGIKQEANNSGSFDLLNQLQAVKLETKATRSCINYETMLPHFSNKDSLPLTTSPSSSSSTCSTAAKEKPSPTYTWRDFLVQDEFLPPDFNTQEQEIASNFSSDTFVQQERNIIPQEKNDIPQVKTNHGVGPTNNVGIGGFDMAITSNDFEIPSSSHSSFLDGILDHENEAFLDFSGLHLEEPFYL